MAKATSLKWRAETFDQQRREEHGRRIPMSGLYDRP
jgi:hypothetical protein